MFNIFVKKYNHIFITFAIKCKIFFTISLLYLLPNSLEIYTCRAKSPSILDQHKKSNEQLLTDILNASIIDKKYEAPRAEFLTEEAQNTNFRDFRGNLLIVYLWATWSADSISELVKLQQLSNELTFQDINNIKIISISLDFKNYYQLKSILTKRNITMEFFLDPQKKLMSEFDFHSLPQTFLIDADGQVVAHINQVINWNDKTIIKQLAKFIDIKKNSKAENTINSSSKVEGKKENQLPEIELPKNGKKTPVIIG